MMSRLSTAVARVGPAIVLAVAAAFAGLAAAPTSASALSARDGYTCYFWDVCNPGSRPCCFETPWIPAGEGRCSTLC